MPINRWSPGCNCCNTPTGSFFGATGDANAIMYSAPCPPSNRLGVDVTLTDIVDCIEQPAGDNPFFNPNGCGTCSRTYSNINGTYFIPFDGLPDISEPLFPFKRYVFGPHSSADNSCMRLTQVDYPDCAFPADTAYLAIDIEWFCTTTLEATNVNMTLCDSAGVISATVALSGSFTGLQHSEILAETSKTFSLKPACCAFQSGDTLNECSSTIQSTSPVATVQGAYVTT